MKITIPKLTQNEFDDLASKMENDLTLFYKLLQDEVLNIIDKNINSERSVEDVIKEIEKLI